MLTLMSEKELVRNRQLVSMDQLDLPADRRDQSETAGIRQIRSEQTSRNPPDFKKTAANLRRHWISRNPPDSRNPLVSRSPPVSRISLDSRNLLDSRNPQDSRKPPDSRK